MAPPRHYGSFQFPDTADRSALYRSRAKLAQRRADEDVARAQVDLQNGTTADRIARSVNPDAAAKLRGTNATPKSADMAKLDTDAAGNRTSQSDYWQTPVGRTATSAADTAQHALAGVAGVSGLAGLFNKANTGGGTVTPQMTRDGVGGVVPQPGATRRSATGGTETLMPSQSGNRWVGSSANPPPINNGNGEITRDPGGRTRMVEMKPITDARDASGQMQTPEALAKTNAALYQPGGATRAAGSAPFTYDQTPARVTDATGKANVAFSTTVAPKPAATASVPAPTPATLPAISGDENKSPIPGIDELNTHPPAIPVPSNSPSRSALLPKSGTEPMKTQSDPLVGGDVPSPVKPMPLSDANGVKKKPDDEEDNFSYA